MDSDAQKRAAAGAALDLVEDGMRLGLGSGSTAEHFVRALGERVAAGLSVVGVPSSSRTEALAEETGVPLTTLRETPRLDLCIDGADEIDPGFNLIKGGGGALLREKIVAYAAARRIIIADASKQVDVLGAFPLPIEVLLFGAGATVLAIQKTLDDMGFCGVIKIRMANGKSYVTDNGNWIFDIAALDIVDPAALAAALIAIPGVMAHGLFTGLADTVILGTPTGLDIRHKDAT